MTTTTDKNPTTEDALRARRLEMLNSRRLRVVPVSFQIWRELLRGTLSPTSYSTAPEDLEVLDVTPRATVRERLDVDVLVWSESFSEVPEGQVIPDAEPVEFGIVYLTLGLRLGDDGYCRRPNCKGRTP